MRIFDENGVKVGGFSSKCSGNGTKNGCSTRQKRAKPAAGGWFCINRARVKPLKGSV